MKGEAFDDLKEEQEGEIVRLHDHLCHLASLANVAAGMLHGASGRDLVVTLGRVSRQYEQVQRSYNYVVGMGKTLKVLVQRQLVLL